MCLATSNFFKTLAKGGVLVCCCSFGGRATPVPSSKAPPSLESSRLEGPVETAFSSLGFDSRVVGEHVEKYREARAHKQAYDRLIGALSPEELRLCLGGPTLPEGITVSDLLKEYFPLLVGCPLLPCPLFSSVEEGGGEEGRQTLSIRGVLAKARQFLKARPREGLVQALERSQEATQNPSKNPHLHGKPQTGSPSRRLSGAGDLDPPAFPSKTVSSPRWTKVFIGCLLASVSGNLYQLGPVFQNVSLEKNRPLFPPSPPPFLQRLEEQALFQKCLEGALEKKEGEAGNVSFQVLPALLPNSLQPFGSHAFGPHGFSMVGEKTQEPKGEQGRGDLPTDSEKKKPDVWENTFVWEKIFREGVLRIRTFSKELFEAFKQELQEAAAGVPPSAF